MSQNLAESLIVTNVVYLPFFEGFYQTEHDYDVYDIGDNSDPAVRNEASDIFWEWSETVCIDHYMELYAKEVYLPCLREAIAEHLEVELIPDHLIEFESIHRPRFYNFSTDRLFVTIDETLSEVIVNRVLGDSDRLKNLEQLIFQSFSQRSGFIPNYSNRLNTWLSDPNGLDHNQLGYVLTALNPDPESDFIDPCNIAYQKRDCIYSIFERLGDQKLLSKAFEVINRE